MGALLGFFGSFFGKAMIIGIVVTTLLGSIAIVFAKVEAGAVAKDRVLGYERTIQDLNEKYATLKKISESQATQALADQDRLEKFDLKAGDLIDALNKKPTSVTRTVCIPADLSRRLRGLN
jgi:hypothetical protein